MQEIDRQEVPGEHWRKSSPEQPDTLGITTYFADRYSAWQRGTNEHFNGRIRKYLPKGTSFENLTQAELNEFITEINNRPRKILGWATPGRGLPRTMLPTGHSHILHSGLELGVGTPLDSHPSVPAGWIDSTPIIMIAEGLLKGDSALTSYLHKHGASWAELSDGSGGASERLTSRLKRIPAADRILILSIAGINNTTQNPVDWRSIKMRDREAWIAFDADLDTNIHVWRAAAKLWEELESREKVDRVRLLFPKVAVGTGIEKAGIDDFLAKVGSWDDLLLHMATGLPLAPVVNADEIPGAWRISKDGQHAEECVAIMGGPNGEITGYRWVSVPGLGARIVASEQRRQPTDEELRTGGFETKVRSHEVEDTHVEIEVSWLGADDQPHTVSVSGPVTI